MLMMIMINMIGWLTGYTIYFGNLYVFAVMLLNFRQKYMNDLSMYVLYTWRLFMQNA